ncbi:MAG: hypothetical protein JAY73_09445 [Candidatus Thiodiazotropha taylori]|nr:hypothetical protein [Candidatus Thiodiazotropha taylori]
MNKCANTLIKLLSTFILSLFAALTYAELTLSEEQMKEIEISGKHQELIVDGAVEIIWNERCLVSGCRGQGCKLHIETAVIQDRIYIDGSVGRCEHSGQCAACIPSQTTKTLSNLPQGKYQVFTSTTRDPFNFTRLPNNLPEISNKPNNNHQPSPAHGSGY